MPNFFDQFDGQPAPKAKPAGNYFDQFDGAPPAPEKGIVPRALDAISGLLPSDGDKVSEHTLGDLVAGAAPKQQVGALDSYTRGVMGSLHRTAGTANLLALPLAGLVDSAHDIVQGHNPLNGPNHGAQDYVASHLVDPEFHAAQGYDLQPNETQGFGAKVSGAVGSLLPDLVAMLATGGESAELGAIVKPVVEKSIPRAVADGIGHAVEHSARASVVPGIKAGVEQAQQHEPGSVLDNLGDVLGGYAQSTATNALPLAAEARPGAGLLEQILTKGAQGAVSMPAVSGAAATLEGHPYTPEQAGVDAVLGSLMGQMGGYERPHAPIGEPVVADAPSDPTAERFARAQAGLSRNADVLGSPEPTGDLDALIAAHLPPDVVEQARTATPEQQAQALGALGTLTGADLRRPEPAPAAATPTETGESPERARLPAQDSFAQQVAATMRQSAAEQSARATRTTKPEESDRVQPVAEPVGSRPAAGDLAPTTGADVARKRAPLNVRMHGQEYPVDSIEDASAKFLQLRDSVGDIGGMHAVELTDESGHPVGYIGHNGEVYEGQFRSADPRATPIFDPATLRRYGDEPIESEAAKPAPAIKPARKRAVKTDSARKPMDLLRVLAANGGLNREAFRREGVDPAEFTRRAGFHYLFRKEGGMAPHDLREFMQQEGYLPPANEHGQETVSDHDAYDVFDRAFRGGEEIYSADQAEAVASHREAERAADEQFHAQVDADPAFADFDPGEKPFLEQQKADVKALAERAYDLGASERDFVDAYFHADNDEHARGALQSLVARLEKQHAAEQGTEAGARASGVDARQSAEPASGFRLESEAARAEAPREVASQGGLFAPPTRGEQVRAATESKDASRNGLGRDLVRPEQGDGELLAGEKPKQASIPPSPEQANNPDHLHRGWATRNASLGERLSAAQKALRDAEAPLRQANEEAEAKLPPGYKTIPYPERGMPDGVALQDSDGNDIAYPLSPGEAAERAWRESGRGDRYAEVDALENRLAPQLEALRHDVRQAREALAANGESPLDPRRAREREAKQEAEHKAREAAAKAARTRAEKKAGKPLADATEELTDADLSDSERSAIDRLRVDRGGLRAKLSRSNGEADADATGIREAVHAAVGHAGVPVEYLRGQDGLPDKTRRQLQDQARARNNEQRTSGLYVPGEKPRVFVFTDVVKTPEKAAFTAAHEIAGHHGLRALAAKNAKVGGRSTHEALDSALTMALQNPTVAAVTDSMMRRRSSTDRLRMAEEALADLAAASRTGQYDEIKARHGVDVPQAQRATLRGAIARVVERLKAIFNAGGAKFTDAQVHDLLENAWQAAKDTGHASPESVPLESTEDAEAAESERKQGERFGKAEAKRNEAADTLDVARGAAGWNYDTGRWEGRKGQITMTRAHLQDKMLAWRDVQGQIESQLDKVIPDAQNVYRLENLMHGRVGDGIDRIEREQVKPLIDAMRVAKVKPDALEEYLYARHAGERNAQIAKINPDMPDGGSGMTNAEAARILAAADKATLEPLAKRVDAITRATRKRLLTHGLITQEAFDAMESQYQHYVPLRGKHVEESADFGGTGMAGRGLDSRGKPVRQALGRGAGNKAQHILGEVIGDAERSVILAEKARVGRSVMRLVLANPNPSLWQVEPVQTERALDGAGEVYEKVVNDWSDPSVIAVRHNGKLFKVQINSVPLAKALNNVGVDQLGAITRVAGAVNRYFSAILTKYNPAFTPVNATRDAIFGLTGLAAEHGEGAALDAALHYPQAAAAAFQQARGKTLPGEWGKWADEFTAHGGKTGYVNMPSAEDIARKIGKGTLSSYSPEGLRRAAHAIGDVVGTINDAVENALRLSAYVTLRKRGASPDKAAAYAKDLTVNFNRKGFDGSKLNAWFLFYNASVQGGHRVAKLLRKPKTYAYLGALAAAQVAATMAAMGMQDDAGEPLWNKIPDHVKRRNLVIVLPPGDGYEASPHVITIPMPYGFNLFPYLAGRISESVANSQRGDDRPSDHAAQLTADAISAATQSLSPVPLDTGAFGLLPNLLRIPVNVQANRNDFGGPIRDESPYGKSDVPRSSLGRPDTLEVFKLTARGLNRLGGGDDLTPPPLSAFDVAPEDVEYLLKELTGGPGQLVTEIATGVQKATGGEYYAQPITPRDVPITKRFLSNIDEQAAQQSLYYDRRETIDRSLKRVRVAFRAQGADAAEAMLASQPELKGAAFKRRKREGRHGEEPGSLILVDGSPQIIVADDRAVYGRYKAAEDAISERSKAVDSAYELAPASILPTQKTRDRDASIRLENKVRQAAQNDFNAAWVRDVVGSVE